MTLAKVAARLNFQNGEPGLPPLLLMTDEERLPDPLTALDRLPAGSGVILRHYGSPQRGALGAALRAATRARKLMLLVAGDIDLALRLSADGFHLPDHGIAARWRLKVPPHWLVTAAAHSEASLTRAWLLGVDAAILSPVFPTASHPGRKALGVTNFARLVASTSMPIYALGGVSDESAPLLRNSGAAGIAGISGLVG